jgi:hypothetical protein
MYHTGICDKSLSTRTVIHALSELKRLIHEKVYIVTGTGITEHSFSEVKTQNGCINLYGIEISGTALSELYITYQNDRFYSHNTKTFLTIVLSLVDAALLLKEKKGLYPTLYLNGVFFDSERMNVTFLPQKLSEFVSRYRTDSEQRLLSFCVRKSGMGTAEDEEDISNAFGRLIYLFFTKNHHSLEDIYDLRSFVRDVPGDFANFMWRLLRGKLVSLNDLRRLIAGAIEERSSNQKGALPFLRRASLLRFRYAFLRFLSIRKKILVIALILLGIGAYLVFDYLKSVDKKDYTAGLDAHQVVELYFKGVDELDLAVIDAVFSRGAGREIKNEISTLYVTTRMHQAFGEKSLNQNEGEIEARPEQPVDAHLGKTQSYGIKDLIIEREKNDESPVFTARYKKFLSSGNKDTVYSIQETIYLKKIDERWYIIKTERTLLNNQHSLE